MPILTIDVPEGYVAEVRITPIPPLVEVQPAPDLASFHEPGTNWQCDLCKRTVIQGVTKPCGRYFNCPVAPF